MSKKEAYKSYMHEIFQHSGLYPTWPPIAPISIGDVVQIDDSGMLVNVTSLKKLKITYESAVTDVLAEYSYRSAGAKALSSKGTAKTKASGIGKAETSISVTFKRDNSILFDLADVQYESITNLSSVEAEISKLFDKEKWEKDWLLVANVMSAKKATILLANSEKSQVELSIGGEAKDGFTSNLAKTGLAVKDHSDMAFMLVAAGPLSPMARCLCMRRKFWSPPKLSAVKRAAGKKASTGKKKNENKEARSMPRLVNCLTSVYPEEFIEHVKQPSDWSR